MRPPTSRRRREAPPRSAAPPGSAFRDLTATGQSLFTLAWASPEQVRQLPLTTASDVYSLGVLLYELLSGPPPYVLDGDFLENARRVCEDEPVPPSSRVMVAREVWNDGMPALVMPDDLAVARSTEARRLRRRLRGDLDAVVLKALAKDPDQRYGSVAELAADLRRHLAGRDVTARRPGWLERIAKLAWRHRARLAVAVLVLAVVGSATVLRRRDAREVRRLAAQRQQAASAAMEATRQADVMRRFVRNLLRAADPDSALKRPWTAMEILNDAEQHIRRDLDEDEEVLAHALEAIALSHQAHGHWDPARRLLSEALGLRRRVYAGDHPLTARSINNLGALEHQAGDVPRAEGLYRLALAMKERLALDEADLLKTRANLASILGSRGRFDEAEGLYQEVLDARLRLYGPNDVDVATSLRSLGVLLHMRGDNERAEPLMRRALEIRRRVHGERTTPVASSLASLGWTLHALGRHEEAEAVLTEALTIREERLSAGHPLVAANRRELALVYFDLGETATATVLWNRALAVLRTRGEDTWEIADAESRLGARLLDEGKIKEAAVCLRESWEKLRRLRGEDAAVTLAARRRLDALAD